MHKVRSGGAGRFSLQILTRRASEKLHYCMGSTADQYIETAVQVYTEETYSAVPT